MVRCFNSGIDHAGHPLKEKPQTIYPFTVMNAHAKNMKTLAKKMYKKTEAGSVGIITQPVYSLDQAKMLVEMMEETNKQLHTNTVLILGIFPITKLRTAQFLSSHVPGINVPNIWIDKLRSANAISAEEEKKVGFEMSLSLLDELQAYHSKIHMMTANNYTLADELLSTMKK
jgi:5,10-methylenetetrahydrofolate reductase